MDTARTSCRVHQCSKCPRDTEYFCESCPCDLCSQCKVNHINDLKTIDHYVMSYREKINYIPMLEICVEHPNKIYGKYCELCQVPACNNCGKHRKHTKINVIAAYKTKRQQCRGTIHVIRSEALFYRPVFFPEIKAEIKTSRRDFSLYQSGLLTKGQRLNDITNYVQADFMYNVFCDFDFKHRCLKQKIEMQRHIVSLQRYVHRYVQSAIRPLKFLSSIKTPLSQINLTLHTSQSSMTESIHKEGVIETLGAVKITERGNRRERNELLLKLIYASEFHQSLTLKGVDCCVHISCVTLNQIWVSDFGKLILTNPTGVTLFQLEDLRSDVISGNGSFTVNSGSELIYIDRNDNIKKLSKDMTKTTTFIEKTDSSWQPQCVSWSPSNRDLLVGMYRNEPETETGKVTRHNQSGQLTQTIQHDDTGQGLYRKPKYITENSNGDVVVSDFNVVVVTERGGRHRFSYTGHPSGSGLFPQGICTDALSHILVCDYQTSTVHMIDKDGQFLSHLLAELHIQVGVPHSLSYDVNTHRLWVGSRFNKKVCVFRYIAKQEAITDQSLVMGSLSEVQITETEKPQQVNQFLLKLEYPPKLLHSFTLTGVNDCHHISCLTSDGVCVSDSSNNIILTNTTGVVLILEELCSSLFGDGGIHTVNSENELIYIDKEFDINKLSKDMKTTTMLMERTESLWRPRCVYWSPPAGDLLVGMCYLLIETGIVTRYNQSGQLTQTIQHDNKGKELYRRPYYITKNNNGDVVVSDNNFNSGAVVVTESGGRHRFSYTGHPSGSGIRPAGICTDALSHILVCDSRTDTVQMLDSDGQFLSYLLTESQEMGKPWSLSYDVNTHRLWVGSSNNNKVVVYKYITKLDAPTVEEPTYCLGKD
nr:uncharacterized protein LOC117691245 [Crassostrea gigas]